jgi:indole-3-glycerol phosphate synthase
MKPTILQEIFEQRRSRVAERRAAIDITKIREQAVRIRASAENNRLRSALKCPGINIIAEFKRASPSKGVINDALDPVETARKYKFGGAGAISVLTEQDFFKGSLDDLIAIRHTLDLAVLQKDFVFDEYQIYEASAAGADAILLIVAMLDDETLKHLHHVAEEELGIDALVEVHDKNEMDRAASIGARLIGVNNRNLKTFDVSLAVSRELVRSAPTGTILVSESGLKTYDDIEELRVLGFNGFLIGETLMKAADPEQALRDLTK